MSCRRTTASPTRPSSSQRREAALSYELPFRHQRAHVAGIDHVLCNPAVEVVFGHALLREPLVTGRRTGHVGDQQRLETDALVVAEVVALIQLVAAAELAADRIPHQL